MTARTAPTSTVSSSWALISSSLPATGEGISVSTLSVETSRSGSSTATSSPMDLSHWVTVPSVTLSPSAGRVTSVAMSVAILFVESAVSDVRRRRQPTVRTAFGEPCLNGTASLFRHPSAGRLGCISGMVVQRLTGKRQVRLAERLVLGRVHVHERCNVFGEGLPVEDELRFADEFTHPRAHHVYADDGAVLLPHDLHEALCLEDLALAVATEVIGQRLDPVVAVPLLRITFRQSDRRDLRVAVRHPRDAGFVDRGGAEAGDVLGDEDALLEAAVRQLQAGHDVADGVHAGHVGLQRLVGEHEAAVHGDALCLVAEVRSVRASADGDQQQVGVERVARLDT